MARGLLDLQADVEALSRRFNSEQKRRTGELGAISRADISNSTKEVLASSLMHNRAGADEVHTLVGR